MSLKAVCSTQNSPYPLSSSVEICLESTKHSLIKHSMHTFYTFFLYKLDAYAWFSILTFFFSQITTNLGKIVLTFTRTGGQATVAWKTMFFVNFSYQVELFVKTFHRLSGPSRHLSKVSCVLPPPHTHTFSLTFVTEMKCLFYLLFISCF